MNEPSATPSEPPSASGDSFPVRAFGHGTAHYLAFLEALLDGLMEYEARKGGSGHAPTPQPAA